MARSTLVVTLFVVYAVLIANKLGCHALATTAKSPAAATTGRPITSKPTAATVSGNGTCSLCDTNLILQSVQDSLKTMNTLLQQQTIQPQTTPQPTCTRTTQCSNIAVGRMAWLSSTFPADTTHGITFEAYNAVDGNHDTNAGHGHCVHSMPETSPWWAVDLGYSRYVTAINFTNRVDVCGLPTCTDRSQNFAVGLTNTSPAVTPPTVGSYSVCATYPGIVPLGVTINIPCAANTPAGRYLIIQMLNLNNYMNFCEVEVWECI